MNKMDTPYLSNIHENPKDFPAENRIEYSNDFQTNTLHMDPEEESSNSKVGVKISSSYKSWVILVLIGFLAFFCLACYDLPGSMETEVESAFEISASEFEVLYTIYCIPNIFLAYFGGFLIDRVLGPEISSLIVSALSIIGQLLFTLGGFIKSYGTLVIARLIYGIGGDTLIVLCNYYLVLWFSGKEMNFVFGLLFALARMGSAFSFFLSAEIVKRMKDQSDPLIVIGSTFSAGLIWSTLILLFFITLAWISKREGKMTFTKCKRLQKGENNNTNCCMLGFTNELCSYSVKYWLINVIFSSMNATVLAFVTCSQQLLMEKYKVSMSTANDLDSAFNLILSLTAPLAGLLVDSIGKRISIITFSFAMSVLSTLLIAVVNCSPYYPLMLLGIFTGVLSATIAPVISLVVSPSQLGSAFGLSIGLLDLNTSIFNTFVGYLLQKYGYEAICLFYTAVLLVGFVSSAALWIIDWKEGGVLDKWGKRDNLDEPEESCSKLGIENKVINE